jgi:3-deoxy-D-manno-octulosonic-acid transferase
MYRAAYHWVSRIVHRLPLPRGTLRTALAGRRQATARWVTWARTHRPDGPLLWVHAASVGEALAAGPVVRRLRSAVPGLTVVHSHTSPSVSGWPPAFERVHADYLPLDEPTPIRAVLDAVRPDLVVFSRGDLWPEFVEQSVAAEIPVAIAGATVAPRSRRLSLPARSLYARALPSVSWIGAVSDADAARWRRLGARPGSVQVTGDPRHDAVVERVPEFRATRTLLPWAEGHAVIVGGSLEPSDERVFLRAAKALSIAHPATRFLLVPHSTTDRDLDRLRRRAAAIGIGMEEWSCPDRAPTAHCVLVTVGGMLFDLYPLADAAYVGGGFSRNDLHAVIEPAVYGVPIVIGPMHQQSRDAIDLLEAGGGSALPPRGADEVLAAIWHRWITDSVDRHHAGLSARSIVRGGASAATVTQLVRLVGPAMLAGIPHPRSVP